jgi:signal transduction histidine kinase
VLILGATFVIASAEIRGVSEREIRHDIASFRSAFAGGGAAELRHAVHEHSEGAPGDSFFLLLGADGAFLEGNIPASLFREGWFEGRMDEATVRRSQELMDAAATNSDGEVRLFSFGDAIGPFRVLAGRNSHILHETREIILACLVYGAGAIALLAIGMGYLVARGPARRVEIVAGITRRIVAGRFDLRLPVTRRRDEIDHLSADINRMLARIETLMDSLRQVSNDIAHDLRTPLARLRQRLDTMLRRPPEPEAFAASIEAAITEADGIIETFNALLRIAQVEAGARRSRFRRLDLSTLVARVCEVYGDVAEEAGHGWTVSVCTGAWIKGDGDLLTQLLANLVENAIAHVPAPGRIAVALEPDVAGWRLVVADDGPGVPESERERIFRRLYRLDRSRSTPGTGLGLAMVAAIADLHEARIEVGDNAPGLRLSVRFAAVQPLLAA